jgi:hypothetical protein
VVLWILFDVSEMPKSSHHSGYSSSFDIEGCTYFTDPEFSVSAEKLQYHSALDYGSDKVFTLCLFQNSTPSSLADIAMGDQCRSFTGKHISYIQGNRYYVVYPNIYRRAIFMLGKPKDNLLEKIYHNYGV